MISDEQAEDLKKTCEMLYQALHNMNDKLIELKDANQSLTKQIELLKERLNDE